VNVRTGLVRVAVSTGDHPGTTRHARCRTTCTSVNVTHHALAAKSAGDPGKRATATSWGSSGRRFKSCQPDRTKPALTSIRAVFLLPRYGGTGGRGCRQPRWHRRHRHRRHRHYRQPRQSRQSGHRRGRRRRGCAVGRQRDQRADVIGPSGRLLRRMLGVHERAGVVVAAVGVEDQALDRRYAHTDR
jgi:hypothetical protein